MATITDEPITCPFTILVDSNESQPWTFDGLRADADKKHRPIVVETRYASLGRHPHGLGDYSIEGFTDRVAVERKSMDDCQGTVLGWDTDYDRKNEFAGRRQRFEKELENLEKIDAALIVVEATVTDCMKYMQAWGKKSAALNAKIFFRSIISYQQRFRCVQWMFCDGRRMAEIYAFRFLERYWRVNQCEQENDSDGG